MTEESRFDEATQRVFAFLSQPEIALGDDGENIALLVCDSQLLREACEDQLKKVKHLSAEEVATLRAALPLANWRCVAEELQARLQSANKFFRDDAKPHCK